MQDDIQIRRQEALERYMGPSADRRAKQSPDYRTGYCTGYAAGRRAEGDASTKAAYDRGYAAGRLTADAKKAMGCVSLALAEIRKFTKDYRDNSEFRFVLLHKINQMIEDLR